MSKLLVVEDEQITRNSLCKLLQRHGYTVSSAASLKAANDLGSLTDYALIISDLRLPGEPGSELLQHQPPLPVLIMTSYASLKSAVELMRQGAIDYISKPFEQADMLAAVTRALNHRRALEPKITQLKLIGRSRPAELLRSEIAALAHATKPILVTGESGTGKSLAARLVHKLSGAEQLLRFNCAADRSEQLLMLLEHCNASSSLILDHIGQLKPALQEQLLSSLDDNEIRLIALSDRPIDQLDQLSQPLLFRLGARRLIIPSLRERTEDIGDIALFLLRTLSGREQLDISTDAIRALEHYPWPGNIRELRNLLEQILASTPELEQLAFGDLPEHLQALAAELQTAPLGPQSVPLTLSLEEYFCQFVTVNQATMSETELAKALGISRKSLWERRQKLNIKRPSADPLDA